jgi:SAM-dependent methyltransferase
LDKKIMDLVKEKSGVRLDIGCGRNKQHNYVGLDKANLPGVDIVWDVEVFPWPIDDECVLDAICSHLIEHIKPWLTLDFFNEIWRIMRPHGQLVIQAPFGVNHYFVQDPTHCNPVNEATFQYLDPRYQLWKIYEPKPWIIHKGFPVWQSDGVIECLMEKGSVEDVEKGFVQGVHCNE